LQASVPTRRRTILQELVCGEAAKVLGLKTAQPIDPRQPLQEFGLDSLMAVQFRNRLATWTDVELPHTLLYNYPTIEQLVDHLAAQLIPEHEPGSQPADESAQSTQRDLDAMTEDDLARMLEEQIDLA
jgi:acyl carrier protein